MIIQKKITMEEAMTYIACGVLNMDLQEDFDGEITCELSEDGDFVQIIVTGVEPPNKTIYN